MNSAVVDRAVVDRPAAERAGLSGQLSIQHDEIVAMDHLGRHVVGQHV